MSKANADIEALIDLMARLPGLGPRSARRAVLHMIKKRALLMTPLADVLQNVAATARECLTCGNIAGSDTCDICASDKRATGEICVVEDVADLWAMERASVFKGRYHVLGGTLSALDAVGPEDLRYSAPDRARRCGKTSPRLSSLSGPLSMARPPHIIFRESLKAAALSPRSPRAFRSAESWITSTTAPSQPP